MNDASFERRLRERLVQMEQTRAENILAGQLPIDQYQRLAGYVGALRDVANLCDEIRAELEK
jgi:hypothetical protein